jgi:hypothetical protein
MQYEPLSAAAHRDDAVRGHVLLPEKWIEDPHMSSRAMKSTLDCDRFPDGNPRRQNPQECSGVERCFLDTMCHTVCAKTRHNCQRRKE